MRHAGELADERLARGVGQRRRPVAVVEQRVLAADLRDIGVLGHDPERLEAAHFGTTQRQIRAQPGEVVVQPVRFGVAQRIAEARRDARRRLGKLGHRPLLLTARPASRVARRQIAQAVNEDIAHVRDVALADSVIDVAGARHRAHRVARVEQVIAGTEHAHIEQQRIDRLELAGLHAFGQQLALQLHQRLHEDAIDLPRAARVTVVEQRVQQAIEIRRAEEVVDDAGDMAPQLFGRRQILAQQLLESLQRRDASRSTSASSKPFLLPK
jgi:hypothetical protein